MNWKFWNWRARPKLPRVTWFPPYEKFRERPDYVLWARQLLRSPEGIALQGYLFSSLPQRAFYRGDSITSEQASLEYGRVCGYLELIAKLQEAATDAATPLEEVEIDYNANLEDEPAGKTT